jgi:hypothetical protein
MNGKLMITIMAIVLEHQETTTKMRDRDRGGIDN